MSNIVVIHVDRAREVKDFRGTFRRAGLDAQERGNDGLVVERGKRVYLTDVSHDPLLWQEEATYALVSGVVGSNVRSIGLSYWDRGLATDILLAIARDTKCVIDTNFELVITGDAFIERLEREPEWDWES